MNNPVYNPNIVPFSLDNISIVFVTPQMAAMFLKNQRKNRNTKQTNLQKIKKDLQEGRWRFNGDPLRFNEEGKLGDGAHRCTEIVATGIGVWCLIIKNIPDEAFDTMDTGSVRSPGDVFGFHDIPNAVKIASLVRAYNSLKSGSITILQGVGADHNSSATNLSSLALLDIYNEDVDGFNNAHIIAASCYRKVRLMSESGIGSMAYYLIKDKHHSQEQVEDFFSQLFTLKNASLNVIRLLYDKLAPCAYNRKLKLDGRFRRAIIIKTWNCYIQGKDLKLLSYNEEKEGKLYLR